MRAYDQAFVVALNSDQPYERDFTDWLGGASLSSVSWVAENALVTLHDEAIDGPIARVWVAAGLLEGYCRVRCNFIASDGREDSRTWDFTIRAI
jgi:hypothetical protein